MGSQNGKGAKIAHLQNPGPQNAAGTSSTGDWINDFIEFTANTTAPLIFRKWGAISAIAGALERKVWIRSRGADLFPNSYIMLVAPPGVGKSVAIHKTQELWAGLEQHHLANSSVTKASLVDDLSNAERRIMIPDAIPPTELFHSLLIASSEFGVLLPAYDTAFMHTLTDLWDCKPYSESRRTRNIQIHLEKPIINMLGGCTPDYLKETLPAGAWDQGFLARVLLIYSGEQIENDNIFDEPDSNTELRASLQSRLQEIGERYGQLFFEEEAKEFFLGWKREGKQPEPDHPKLVNYNTRRVVHLLKLSIIASVNRSADMKITKADVVTALDWLIEAEAQLPDAFKAMAAGGDGKVIEETYHFVYHLYMRHRRTPVPESKIIMFVKSHTPSHNIMRIIDIMKRAKMIKGEWKDGQQVYTPLGSSKADR